VQKPKKIVPEQQNKTEKESVNFQLHLLTTPTTTSLMFFSMIFRVYQNIQASNAIGHCQRLASFMLHFFLFPEFDNDSFRLAVWTWVPLDLSTKDLHFKSYSVSDSSEGLGLCHSR